MGRAGRAIGSSGRRQALPRRGASLATVLGVSFALRAVVTCAPRPAVVAADQSAYRFNLAGSLRFGSRQSTIRVTRQR
jgi:hypothetical protein